MINVSGLGTIFTMIPRAMALATAGAAAEMADDAREIEKYGDTVQRRPHYDDGSYLSKRKLLEKPSKPS